MFRKRDQPRLWRATFAVVGWTALALQYLLMVAPVQGWTVLERTINYFSFFTILTNILVALAFTGPPIDGSVWPPSTTSISAPTPASIACWTVPGS